MGHTFCELATVKLAGLQLDGDDVPEGLVQKLDGDTETCCGHFCVREWREGFVQSAASLQADLNARRKPLHQALSRAS